MDHKHRAKMIDNWLGICTYLFRSLKELDCLPDDAYTDRIRRGLLRNLANAAATVADLAGELK